MLSPTGFFGRFANSPLTKDDKHETKKNNSSNNNHVSDIHTPGPHAVDGRNPG